MSWWSGRRPSLGKFSFVPPLSDVPFNANSSETDSLPSDEPLIWYTPLPPADANTVNRPPPLPGAPIMSTSVDARALPSSPMVNTITGVVSLPPTASRSSGVPPPVASTRAYS